MDKTREKSKVQFQLRQRRIFLINPPFEKGG